MPADEPAEDAADDRGDVPVALLVIGQDRRGLRRIQLAVARRESFAADPLRWPCPPASCGTTAPTARVRRRRSPHAGRGSPRRLRASSDTSARCGVPGASGAGIAARGPSRCSSHRAAPERVALPTGLVQAAGESRPHRSSERVLGWKTRHPRSIRMRRLRSDDGQRPSHRADGNFH